MTTRIGTSYFESCSAAERYYRYEGGDTREIVQRKLAEGVIHIGRPRVLPREYLEVIPGEGRYQIVAI